ncbi:aspartate dehydrogenase [Methanococcus aeolicus]|uniref:aspartate dehydrogenase n=1 Tax=Methanococcus aeolicus TaxID=42879 RepID=UPI0021C6295C|nr:aspartate dehydrogenase [Methanococcus aeolicus]UXM84431.1 aspartate dehydrogenase [Methanococcus aeolicus]
MLKIGIIGCGTIATMIAKAITYKKINGTIVALYDKHNDKSQALSKLTNAKICDSIDKLVKEELDIVIECASIKSVEEVATKSLNHKKNVVIMSVGALADKNLFSKLYKIANDNEKKIFVPSGAIAGVDAIKTASIGRIDEVSLITTKPVYGLEDALKNKGIDTTNISEPTVVFEGTVFDAIKEFPQNINVSVVLSIASKIPAKVKIVADPSATSNKHEIIVKGSIGTIKTVVENNPCKDNPKTSALAAYSVIRLLKDLSEPIIVGT